MEKKRTQADVRRERFNQEAKIAKDLADLALREIDEALEAEQLFENWIERGDSNRFPITDDDTLASPIGYYEKPPSIYG